MRFRKDIANTRYNYLNIEYLRATHRQIFCGSEKVLTKLVVTIALVSSVYYVHAPVGGQMLDLRLFKYLRMSAYSR